MKTRPSASAYITKGDHEGRPVRRARKTHTCDGWSEMRHHANITAGSLYVEGEVDIDRAGGFGHKRYCLACCGALAVDKPHLQKEVDMRQAS